MFPTNIPIPRILGGLAILILLAAIATFSTACGQTEAANAPAQIQQSLVSLGQDPKAPAPSQAIASQQSNTFPTTVGELRAMGLNNFTLYDLDSDEFPWGWGEYTPTYELIQEYGKDVEIVTFRQKGTNNKTPAWNVLNSAVWLFRTYASAPEIVNTPQVKHMEGKWEPQTIQASEELAKRLFIITPKTTKFGTYYELEFKDLQSASVEPDEVLGVIEKTYYGAETKALVFSSIVTIDIEGEELLRFRMTSTFPFVAYDPAIQILK